MGGEGRERMKVEVWASLSAHGSCIDFKVDFSQKETKVV